MPKSREEVEELKRQWVADPIFDLEWVEGFEEYHDELLEFSSTQRAHWDTCQYSLMREKREAMGVPANLRLADYLMELERRIEWLERKMDNVG